MAIPRGTVYSRESEKDQFSYIKITFFGLLVYLFTVTFFGRAQSPQFKGGTLIYAIISQYVIGYMPPPPQNQVELTISTALQKFTYKKGFH